MTTVTDFVQELEGHSEVDEDPPTDVWERLWEEWVPFADEFIWVS